MLADPRDIPEMETERNGHRTAFHGSWYRGPHTNWIPSKAELAEPDALDRFILLGSTPPAPFIGKSTAITAFGSCFAQNISEFLHNKNFNILGKDLCRSAHIVRFGEGMVNTFAIRQQFEWAKGERDFDDVLWIGPNKELASHDPEVRAETRDIILSTDTFIITLGLSEIWYDKVTGEAFWRAIPKDLFDPERHGFRVSTFEENKENLRAICRIVRQMNKQAKIIFTLSPLPLMATFRPVACLMANAASKAILRAALDEFMRENANSDWLYYFPSYEIVGEMFVDPRIADNRHIRPEILNIVMEAFQRHYCLPDPGTSP